MILKDTYRHHSKNSGLTDIALTFVKPDIVKITTEKGCFKKVLSKHTFKLRIQ